MRYLILLMIFTLFYTNSIAQIEISGKVTNCENKGIIGATVRDIKSKTDVYTDSVGEYTLTVDSDAVLRYAGVGYIPEFIKVGNQTTINMTLHEDTTGVTGVKVRVRAGKPIIYLYPVTEMDISVQFQYNGEVQVTYPEYNNGWNVHALPNGTLYNKTDNKKYSYLFWEGEKKTKPNESKYSNGFIVSKDSAVSFLQNILPKIGLEPHEYNEFIVYWLPFLKVNNWDFIYFRTTEEYNLISKNIVTPKPETEIRVFMEFKGIEKPFKVKPQTFLTPTRKGFTLVEWGGSQLTYPISILDENKEYIVK